MDMIRTTAFVLFMILCPSMTCALPYYIENFMDPPNASVDTGAMWKGRLWFYVKEKKGEDDCVMHLKSLDTDSASKPRDEMTADIPCTETWVRAWLFNGGDRLWLISNKYSGYFQAHKFIRLENAQSLDDISKPFLYQNTPSVLEHRGNKLALLSLWDGVWKENFLFRIGRGEIGENAARTSQVVSINNNLHIFWRIENRLYYHQGIPDNHVIMREDWKKIHESDAYRMYWSPISVVAMNNAPAVFNVSKEIMRSISYLKRSGDSWQSFKVQKTLFIPLEATVGIYPFGDSDDFVLMTRDDGPATAATFHDRKMTSSIDFGSFSPIVVLYETGLATGVMLILWLIIEFIIKLISPYWYYAIITSFFIDKRILTGQEVDINDLMTRDYSQTKSYLIKKWPKKSALTLRPKRGAKIHLSFDRATVFFKNTAAGTEIKLVSKWSLAAWFLLVWMLYLIYSYSVSFWLIIGPLKTILIMCPVVLLTLRGAWRLLKGCKPSDRDRCREDLDIILSFLGIDEPQEEQQQTSDSF